MIRLTSYDNKNSFREVKITYDYETVVDWLYSSSIELYDVSTGDCLSCDAEITVDWQDLLQANLNYPNQKILDKYALTYIEGNILAHKILDGLENGDFTPSFNNSEFYEDVRDFVDSIVGNLYFKGEVLDERVQYLMNKHDWDEDEALTYLILNPIEINIIGGER